MVRSCRGSHEEAIPTHALPRGAPMLAPMADDGGGHAWAHTGDGEMLAMPGVRAQVWNHG